MKRSVLVLNSGSSSLKYALYTVGQNLKLSVQGLVEQIGSKQSTIKHTILNEGKNTITENHEIGDHKTALRKVVGLLHMSKEESKAIAAVGHRVVHGGEAIDRPTLITEELKKAVEKASPLAPLHNPPNLEGIRVAEELFSCPQVAVFDTAFHSTIPPNAYLYGIPYHLYKDLGIRRYGFHGTSYLYLMREAAKFLGKPSEEINIICLHLGAGASMACIEQGKCIDTTMGVTPLEGLIMATRSGDIDPAIPKILFDLKKLSPEKVDDLLNKKSGLFGLCGEKDMKTIVEKAQLGEKQCKLALDVYIHRIRKYLGAYLVHLEGKVDAIVFSAGIGERSAPIRKMICEGLDSFGISVDIEKNEENRKDSRDIQSKSSSIKVLVLPTDEELCIAQQTMEVLHQLEKLEREKSAMGA